MKKLVPMAILLLAVSGIAISWYFVPSVGAFIESYIEGTDPDLPDFQQATEVKEAFMAKRAEHFARLRGVEEDKPFDPQLRVNAVEQMEEQVSVGLKSSQSQFLADTWTPIGPAPIPNGQTVTVSTPVSGRTTAIDVHPADPNIVYVGTAHGGLYRSLDGGTTWTPLLDNALSLAIGAVRISPSQPDTVYVGTGEPNFSADSYFGVGLYRIDNASTTPTVVGPLGGAQFAGRAISEILVHPTDPNTVFASTTTGVSGIGSAASPTQPSRGVYRSTDATSASPTFARLTGLPNDRSIRDMVLDPLNPNLLVVWLVMNGGGIYVSEDALAASPTFAHPATGTVSGSTSTSELNGELAIQHTPGNPNPTIYAATGNQGGRVLLSIDNGATWIQQVDNNFCTPQCFYNIAIETDPIDPTRVYLGGGPNFTFGISTTAGAAFVDSRVGLHVDSHAITVAPSLPTTIYFGSDGGIYKSTDSGATWTPLNNNQFFATQFVGLDVHPTDPNFTLGGTQDNGTNLFRGTAEAEPWRRVDGGDGGDPVVDQGATSTTNLNLYHTYFSQVPTQVGYAYRGTALGTSGTGLGGWQLRGCNTSTVSPRNGISCDGVVNFYAPLERGPVVNANGSSIYYGADRLYRSDDLGVTNTVVSQNPISANVPISAIGISLVDDNVRIIGQNNGALFGTLTGATTLANFDASENIPAGYISRVVMDPTNPNVAYVTLARFGVATIWKTTNLSSGTPTWTAANGSGANVVPQIPVNAFLVDPLIPNNIYAGTDIGVYASQDGGMNWVPFGTGMPIVPVFGLKMAPGATPADRMVRAATHGKGMYQISALLAPSAAGVTVSGKVLTAFGAGVSRAVVTITDMQGNTRTAKTNPQGHYKFEEIEAGQTYIFNVSAKNYQFQPKVFTVNENLSDFDLTADKNRIRRVTRE